MSSSFTSSCFYLKEKQKCIKFLKKCKNLLYHFCLDSYFPFIWEALKRKLLREEVKRKGQEGKEEKEKTKQWRQMLGKCIFFGYFWESFLNWAWEGFKVFTPLALNGSFTLFNKTDPWCRPLGRPAWRVRGRDGPGTCWRATATVDLGQTTYFGWSWECACVSIS